MLNELNHLGMNLELGKYYHHAGSMHVYDRHYSMLEDINSGNYFDHSDERLKLSSDITLSGCPSLPGMDMPKPEIKKYVSGVEEKLFREYP